MSRPQPRTGHHRLTNRSIARLALVAVAIALTATPLAAHEFWLQPESFRLEVGAPIGVRVYVGDGFEKGEPYARNPRHIMYFQVDPEEIGELAGEAGDEPAAVLTADEAGLATLVYRSFPSRVSLEPEPFERYLRNEGLEAIVAERAALGESDKPGSEAFSRCAKSLVEVGDGPVEGYEKPLGLALEIVPLASPFALAADDELEVRVLWRGEPLDGAQVRAYFEGEPQRTFTVRTDADGVARLAVGGPGARLLSVVHMERADAGSAVDWESTWSSLTFEVATSP